MAIKPIDNERKACDAVARSLEELYGTERSNAHSPEDDRVHPPIEYVFRLSQKTYAMEHSIVEAFDGQLQTDVHFGAFVEPIIEELDHQLPPPGRFRLFFPIDPSKGMKRRDIAKAQVAIVAWVRMAALELHNECPQQPSKSHKPYGLNNSRQETIEGVDLQLHRETGHWMPDKAKGLLTASRFAPPGYQALRPARLSQTMNKKLPKLEQWRKKGARSLLVLENRDIALSNHALICEAAEQALMGRSDFPDEIWLVDTTIKKGWTVWCLMRDGVAFPDETSQVRFREFNPDELKEV